MINRTFEEKAALGLQKQNGNFEKFNKLEDKIEELSPIVEQMM